jgi:cytochrome P450
MATTTLSSRRTAPGPRGRSQLDGLRLMRRNLSDLQRDPYELFLRLHQEFGGIVRLRLGPYLTHLITDPELVKHVLVDNRRNYARGRMYDNFKLFFGAGLLTTDGAVWRAHRRVVQPAFHHEAIDATTETIAEVTSHTLDRWQSRADFGEAFDLVPELMRLSLTVLGKVMFGADLAQPGDEVDTSLRFALRAMIVSGHLEQLMPRWMPTPYNRKLRHSQQVLHGLMDRVLAERLSRRKQGHDLLSLLLSAADEDGGGFDRAAVHDEMMTIFLAGHETTGTALAWTLYALATRPEVRARVEHEVDRALAGRVPGLADLASLPYTRMVVEESLRLCPPIWTFPRDALTDDQVGGYHIPAGSSVFLSPYVTHRCSDLWDNPEAFDPERFSPERAMLRPRFAYFPFGGGQRQCIGQSLALLQLQIVTAMVAQRVRLHPVPGHQIACAQQVSLRPAHGIPVTVHPRS